MFANGRRMVMAFAAVVALLLISQSGCNPFEELGGPLTVPLRPAMRGKASPSRTRTANRPAERHLPAPVRRASVPGGELPALANLPGQFRLGKGITYGAIRVFPIYSSTSQGAGEKYISLAQAQQDGQAEITERTEGASVGSVQIRNNSDRPIYVVSGDVITGGRQDRVIAMDMIIPPGQGQAVDANVYCVESGRWSAGEGGDEFECKEHACINLKKSLVSASVSQSAVWAKVGQINAVLGTASATGTYARAFDSSSASSKIDAYVRKFAKEFKKDNKAVGFAVCAGKKVVGCDIFASPSLLSAMRDKLISSYVMGILSMEDRPNRPTAKAGDVAKLFEQAGRADASLASQGNGCKVYRIQHGEMEGFYTEVAGRRTHFFLGAR